MKHEDAQVPPADAGRLETTVRPLPMRHTWDTDERGEAYNLYTEQQMRAFAAEESATIERMRDRFRRILEEPSNTMSDAKALREILRQAKLGIAGA